MFDDIHELDRKLIGLTSIASKINVTHKGVKLSEKLELTAALCNEILTAVTNLTFVIMGK